MSAKNVPINLKKLSEFFDNDQRLVKEHEFRRAIFTDGVHDEARQLVWKFLFQFYPFNSTNREREIIDDEKNIEYQVMKSRWDRIIRSDASPQIDFGLQIELNKDEYKNLENPELSQSANEAPTMNLECMKIQSILRVSRVNVSKPLLIDDIKQIDKDIDRTRYLIEMEQDQSFSDREKGQIKDALRSLLVTFAAFNQSVPEVDPDCGSNESNLGYTQGVFIQTFNREFEAYWCFSNFMLLDTYSTSSIALNTTKMDPSHVLKTNVAYYFSETGMWKKLNHLSYLLSFTDAELYSKLEQYDLKNLTFCHEWLLLNFKRCFSSTRDFLKCFELLNSHFIELHNSALKGINVKNLYSFDLFICLSLLKQIRDEFLTKCSSDVEFFDVFSQLNKSEYFARNFEAIVREAEMIFDQYCIISHTVSDVKEERKSAFEKIKNYFFF